MMNRLMKMSFAAALAAGAWVHAQAAPVQFDWFDYQLANPPALEAGHYHNPILAGFQPDPSICRVGDKFYLVNSSFAYFPGIPIYESADLVNWKQIGNVIHRPEQLGYGGIGVSNGIYAPAISFHDGTFYVICTMVGREGNFVVTAKDPAGPWSDPVRLQFDGIDPSIFFDDDGKAWVVNNGGPEGPALYNGHRAIWIQQFDSKEMKLVGPRKVIVNGGVDLSKQPIWIEGPHLFKKGDWYYLMCAEGGTSQQHSEVIFRSKSPEGPFTPWDQNPILTQRDLDAGRPDPITCTGHADLTIGPGGQWYGVFLGMRPYRGDSDMSPMGRETFMLPVTWTDDGWPVILEHGKPVPTEVATPTGDSVTSDEALRLAGLKGYRDDFSESALSPAWIMLRTPGETWWKLDGGKLELTPRADRLSRADNPSYLARRVRNASFTASTELTPPAEPGIAAGLVAFQSDQNSYAFTVARDGEQLRIEVGQDMRGQHKVLNTVTIPAAETLTLRMVADKATCSFAYKTAGDWQTVTADADATLLTTSVAGGFVGSTVGLYARSAQ